MLKPILLAALTLTATVSTAAPTRATLTGKVTDTTGKLLPNATVMIYEAGVKQGYSTFCPSCYIDCGKRATTDRTGAFTFTNLDPDLWFKLLVIRDGYTATVLNKVNPAQQPVATAALSRRAPVNDPGRLVRGRVVDPTGRPLPAAVVMPKGVSTAEGSTYGTLDGLEPIAVTNERGEFELANSDPATGILVEVQARGMATKLIALPTGGDRKTITVSDGAIVRGRLVNHGKPVAGAEIGLIARERGGFGANLKIIGNPYDEIRIGTQSDGSFVITNVPASVDWYAYGKMESIASLGATQRLEFSTGREGLTQKEAVNLGDLDIRPGHRLAGKVTLSDGAPIPDGMRITLGSREAWDSQIVMIGRDGRFAFLGIPPGSYDITPSVRGYSVQGNDDLIAMTVDRDRDDLAITLAPSARR